MTMRETDSPLTARFGDLLRRFRVAAGLTQIQLAERSGLSLRGVSDLERGLKLRPRQSSIDLLVTALGLGPSEQTLLKAAVRWQGAPMRHDTGRILSLPPRTRKDVPTILPIQLTSFVGREAELDQVCQLLAAHRLVTLIGPPGTGKTRLALEVAAAVAEEFANGIYFVPLAALSDPTLIFASIARSLGIEVAGDRSPFDRLIDTLPNQRLLLVLDNFEQVVSAATPLVQLLAAVPGPKMLVTSRVALQVRGEQVFPVPPLAVPDPAAPCHVGTDLGSIPRRYPSIRLFLERSRAVRPDFDLSSENVKAVADLCRRLDGLPLAIELAAARSTILSPAAMLNRLEQRLPLLTGGAQDLPSRQQTLDAAITWSYNLLDAAEQSLFRRLGVFVGAWDAEAAAAVCLAEPETRVDSAGQATLADLGPPDILDRLESLVRKSLIQPDKPIGPGASGDPRFSMLGTLREYAWDRLVASGELEAVRRQHAAYFLALAEQSPITYFYYSDTRHHDRLELEHDNLRAALQWFADQADAERGFRMIQVLANFWYVRGYLTEGQSWLDASLARSGGFSAELRAEGLWLAGELAHAQGNLESATWFHRESVAIGRQLGDRRHLARVLNSLGRVARDQCDYPEAIAALEESLHLSREHDDWSYIACNIGQLGVVARQQSDSSRAQSLLEESLQIQRPLDQPRDIGATLLYLGLVAEDQGDYAQAQSFYEQSIKLMWQIKDRWHLAFLFEASASVAVARGDIVRGVVLGGAAAALRQQIASTIPPSTQPRMDRALGLGREHLGEEGFGEAWAEGQGLTLEQAIQYSLKDDTN